LSIVCGGAPRASELLPVRGLKPHCACAFSQRERSLHELPIRGEQLQQFFLGQVRQTLLQIEPPVFLARAIEQPAHIAADMRQHLPQLRDSRRLLANRQHFMRDAALRQEL